MATITQENISGRNGFRITGQEVSIGLTPSIGGRIMSFRFRDEELFYIHDPERGQEYSFPDQPDWSSWKRSFGFRLFGGDKTWVAPEYAWVERIPPLDLDAGAYSLRWDGKTAVMESRVCRETGLKIVRRVTLNEDDSVLLVEELHNQTSSPVLRSIWNVTQVLRPFQVILPAGEKDVRSYHLDDTTLPEPVVHPSVEGDMVSIVCKDMACYKYGAMLREGCAWLMKKCRLGELIFSRHFPIDRENPYAHRSMVEVFNSPAFNYGEIEVHAPLSTIPPGGKVSFEQLWRLKLHSSKTFQFDC